MRGYQKDGNSKILSLYIKRNFYLQDWFLFRVRGLLKILQELYQQLATAKVDISSSTFELMIEVGESLVNILLSQLSDRWFLSK